MKAVNGSGGLRKRADGRWEGRYHVEVGGKWERRSVFARNKGEAREKMTAKLAERDGGIIVAGGRETFGDYLDSWLAFVKDSLAPRTYASYEQVVRDHLKPGIGRIPLKMLQPLHLQAHYQRLLKNMSAKTVRNVHGVAHRALDKAVQWRLLTYNPADAVDQPKYSKREMQSLTRPEVDRVLEAAAHDDLEAFWRLALTTGMRQGELLALRWPQVDLEARIVRVTASLIRVGKGDVRLSEPKTKRSRRQVKLTAKTAEALQDHHSRQVFSAMATGGALDPGGYVFAREDGRPMSDIRIWKRWTSLLNKAGVRHVRFHDARHTVASMLLDKNVHIKKVSETLGHASIGITGDLYSHVSPTMQDEVVGVMEDLFG